MFLEAKMEIESINKNYLFSYLLGISLKTIFQKY